jgi:hypothetical protein
VLRFFITATPTITPSETSPSVRTISIFHSILGTSQRVVSLFA